MYRPVFIFLVLVVEWERHWCAPVPTRLVDLTHDFEKNVAGYPLMPKFEINETFLSLPPLDFRIKVEVYSSGTHVGTHMDAPTHFVENRQAIDDIPLEHLMAPAAVVDVQEKAALNPDYELQTEDLLQWENTTGYLLNEIILLVRSGWSKRWNNRTAFIGNPDNDVSNLHFPGISGSAAQWIVTNRNVYGVGVESLSLDHGPSKEFAAHVTLLDKNIYGLENVGNMEELPIFGATLYVMPMKIAGASGAPCRIVATFPDIIY